MPIQLDAEKGIPELAKLANVSDDTMRRRLVNLHREKGDVLIAYKTGKRTIYKSTLAKLRKAAPHIFGESNTDRSDVDDLRQKVAELNKRVNALAASHREFQKKAHEWFIQHRR